MSLKRKISEDQISSNESDSEIEEVESEEIEEEEESDLEDSSEFDESDVEDNLDISHIDDNINLKDISDDDELVIEEVENDDDLYLNKHLHDNQVSNDGNESKITIPSIANDLVATQTGTNRAQIDEYEYDSSDEEDVLNTIGNIPYEWYKDYVHIGYDVGGRKIVKPPKVDEIDEFLKKMDDPTYWRTVKSNLTGQNVILTDKDLDLIKRIRNAKCPDPEYNLHAPFIDFFSYEKMIHPVTNRPETKASFIPSLSEKRIVSKLVSAIKKSRLKPKKEMKKDSQFNFTYDLWEKEEGVVSKRMQRYIPAPKLKPPGHEESYNPPPEYLMNEEESKAWQEEEPEERKTNFIPKQYSSLRQVPAYSGFVRERFERCLDLYLCPRARKNRIQVNPEDLIPQLPRPADLQPFPSVQSLVYRGHEAKVVSIHIEPKGQFFASVDDGGALKIWEILTGRCFKTINFDKSITSVSWYPNNSKSILAIVIEKSVYLVNCGVGEKQVISQTDEYIASLEPAEELTAETKPVVEWIKVEQDSEDWNKGIRIVIRHHFEIRQLTWHSGGEYFATVMPTGANRSVVIHHLTKQKSQVPFKKSKDIIKCVQFHPTRAYFFVATKKSIRIYDLIKQDLTKKLTVNCNEVTSIAIHPGGDNLIVGSVEPRVQWFDLDLSTKAYKTLRYHSKSIRNVTFHTKYPLFASAADDGTVVISHGMVYSDLLQNALIVPVKVLKARNETRHSAMLDCAFHPTQPWILASSSNTIRLFT